MNPENSSSALQKLIAQLQLAYSGELAAGYAYRGHWNSLRQPEQKTRIRQIEEEEWHHRKLVGELLRDLGAKPKWLREIRAFLVGQTLRIGCHLAGWFLPMYGAGKLESKNVREYEIAARFAQESGHPELIDCLLTMAEVEWEHEFYFRSQIEGHAWLKWCPLWPTLPAKEAIREGWASTPLSTDIPA